MNKEEHRQKVSELGIKKIPTAKAIRHYCFQCAGSWRRVNNCENSDCYLWAFRFGFVPFTKINSKRKPPPKNKRGSEKLNGSQQIPCATKKIDPDASMEAKPQNGKIKVSRTKFQSLLRELLDSIEVI